ncbi:hypothetical protein GCM10010191_22640 [Actinomadura vinacea]|uniref:Uncharacterized protein n=1 Tax=Actinomadura vinacea TaxID=115336 RepID=A0ABN3ISG7_9ACTN
MEPRPERAGAPPVVATSGIPGDRATGRRSNGEVSNESSHSDTANGDGSEGGAAPPGAVDEGWLLLWRVVALVVGVLITDQPADAS